MLFEHKFLKRRDLAISKGEVLRYLGYKSGKKPPAKRILQMIEQEMEEARQLVAPRGYFGVFEAAPLRRERMFSDAEKMAFGVCTIGSALEKRVQELFSRGEGARGVILDAVGSATVERVADLLEEEVLKWGSRKGLRATRRFSPGYGGWPVEGQELIFGYLKEAKERTGISLSPSKMMDPIKSVSFAIKLGKGHMEEINKGACSSCTLYGRCSFQNWGRNTCECKVNSAMGS